MSITALSLTCSSSRSAGIDKLYLIDVADLTSFTLASGLTSTYGTITLPTGNFWFEIEFEQDQAFYKQTIEGEMARGMQPKVKHEVQIFINECSLTVRDALQDILDASPCGVFVVVKDNNAVYWAIGYCEDFLKTRPARPSALEYDSKMALGEVLGGTLTLEATNKKMGYKVTATIVTS